ncbi:MAG: transposase, partial [Pseudolabrys sp.]
RTDHVTLMRGAAAIGAGWQLGDSHHSHADTGASSEPVRRLEVFTGRRRRTWPAEQKARILAESYESGEKVSSCAAARVDAAAAVRVVSSSAPGMPKPNRRPTSRALITSGSRSPAAPRP